MLQKANIYSIMDIDINSVRLRYSILLVPHDGDKVEEGRKDNIQSVVLGFMLSMSQECYL